MNAKENIKASLISFLCVLLAYLVYLPGLSGPFLLDDFHNLEPLAYGGGVYSWDDALRFIFGRGAGMEGRPVSMASFLLDDFTWPANPSPFKHTSLLFHCATGLLVFLLARKLLVSQMGFSQKKAILLAIVIQIVWLIHPLQVSTVLYVVQRMTILAAFFSIASFWVYLIIREKIMVQEWGAATLLSIGFLVLWGLGCMSKQNSILVLGFAVVCELYLFSPILNAVTLSRARRLFAFGSILLIILLMFTYDSWGAGYTSRDFTFFERIILQIAILGDYVGKIVMPTVDRFNIFDERFSESSIALNNLDFIFGIIVFFATIACWIISISRKQKLVVFGFAWFFFFHLLESTVLPLELYFEHRNYLPIFGLILVMVGAGRVAFNLYGSMFVATSLSIIAPLYLTYCTVLMTKAWSSPLSLYVKSVGDEPRSIRARLAYAAELENQGLYQFALAELREAAALKPESVGIPLSMVRLACIGGLELGDGEIGSLMARSTHFDTYALSNIKGLVELDSNELITCKTMQDNLSMNELFDKLPRYSGFDLMPNAKAQFWDARAKYYTFHMNFPEVMRSIDLAIGSTPDVVDLYIKKIVYLSSAGLYEAALETIPDATLADEGRPKFTPSRSGEIEFLEGSLRAQLREHASDNRDE